MNIYQTTIGSPVGTLLIEADEKNIIGSCFLDHKKAGPCRICGNRVLKKCCNQLKEYFRGKRKKFDLPLKPEGTEFQEKVWHALESVPYGKTVTYGSVARSIKKPAAVRAVGQALHANPMVVLIPCHRVLDCKAKLSGYAAGTDRKKWLLKHES